MHMRILARSVAGLMMLLSLLPVVLRAQESALDVPIVMEELVYAIKGKDTLALDYYHPAADSLRNKFLVIFVHGGGFSGGSRREEANSYFSRQLATFGYQSASISYRLTAKGKGFGCNRPAAEKLETFKAAVEDVYDATEYFRQRAKRAGQDSLHIILAGSSAGAEAILHAVYWPEKVLAPPSSPLPAGYRYAGIISMAGALADTSQINRTNAVPSLFFHGTEDNLVPYGVASHHFCAEDRPGHLILYGPEPITAQLNRLEAPYYNVVFRHGKHEWSYLPLISQVSLVYDFIEHDIIYQFWRQANIVQKSY